MYTVYSDEKQGIIGNRSEEFRRQINSGVTYIVLLIIEDLCATLKQSWDVEPRSLLRGMFFYTNCQRLLIVVLFLLFFCMAACFQIQLMGYFAALLNLWGQNECS